MLLKKAIVKKVLKSKAVRETAKFGIKLVLTEKFLSEHKHLRMIVKYI
jgi:hypothetical protein